mmetsp:Transcript_41727/g.81565  ORF Transcript_41727/g.81565 Transcript_41727/m.81565 type:complete len:384 (-) Transcript_41727:319-1470(-)
MVPSNQERRCSWPYAKFPWEQGADENSWSSFSDSNYASCATACKPGSSRNVHVWQGRELCYESDGQTTATLPRLPAEDASSYMRIRTQREYCACLSQCETCVGNNGGCGRNNLPPNTTGDPYHDLLWGTCTGSCKPKMSTPAPTPAPATQADAFTCDVPTAATTISATIPDWDHCLPKCVDCLAKAKAGNCDENGNGCRSISPRVSTARAMRSGESHPGCVSTHDDYLATAYAGNVKIQAAVPVIDFAGECVRGKCHICKSGNYRCGSKGIKQECQGGRWHEYMGTGQATRMSMPWVYSILAFVLLNVICINVVIIHICIRKQPIPSKPAALDKPHQSMQAAFGSQGPSASPIEIQPTEAVAFSMPLSRPTGSDEALGNRSAV